MRSILWQYAIGPEPPDGYRLTCEIEEDLEGAKATLTVSENGRELSKQTIDVSAAAGDDAWKQPYDQGELLRLRYFGHAMDRMRPIFNRYRPR